MVNVLFMRLKEAPLEQPTKVSCKIRNCVSLMKGTSAFNQGHGFVFRLCINGILYKSNGEKIHCKETRYLLSLEHDFMIMLWYISDRQA